MVAEAEVVITIIVMAVPLMIKSMVHHNTVMVVDMVMDMVTDTTNNKVMVITTITITTNNMVAATVVDMINPIKLIIKVSIMLLKVIEVDMVNNNIMVAVTNNNPMATIIEVVEAINNNKDTLEVVEEDTEITAEVVDAAAIIINFLSSYKHYESLFSLK